VSVNSAPKKDLAFFHFICFILKICCKFAPLFAKNDRLCKVLKIMIRILDIAGYWICEKYAAREEKTDVFSTLNSVYQNGSKEQLFGLNQPSAGYIKKKSKKNKTINYLKSGYRKAYE
jgi:hypothetical protein